MFSPMDDLSHFSWPFFDSSHLEFARSFHQWVRAELSGFEPNEGGDGIAARQIFERFATAGWLQNTLTTQTSIGPRKISLRRVSLMREISAFSSAIADVALSEPWLGILPIALYGSQRLQDELLPDYLSGRLLPAFAMSEPDAGSDAAAISTSAHLDGDHYVINGRKTWTSNCGPADLYVVFARIEGQAGAGGIAAFAVDGHDVGIELEERLSVLPPHTVGTWTLTDCRVPSHRLIGELGQGFKIAERVLELFRPTVGAATLGFARRAMSEAVERSVKRQTFTKPISEHQLIQAKFADMAVGIDAAALLVYRAAWQHDATERSISREAAIAKLYSTETAFDIIDQALHVSAGAIIPH
jgi:acyl-CoA dehydrogenase